MNQAYPTGLDAAIVSLKDEERRLADKEKSLSSDLAAVQSDRLRIVAALKALGKRSVPAATEKSKKPAPNNSLVISVIEEVLTERGVLDENELREAVEETIASAGNSKVGFSLRFKQALKDKRFVDSPGGYKLASLDEDTASKTQAPKPQAVNAG